MTSADEGIPGHVRIFDTTLRDGEQSPGCTMTRAEKVLVARQLARLNVDVIEAGFPAASPGDFDAVHAVASEVATVEESVVICGLARATEGDIECCARALAHARRPRIHTFLATSPIHREHKLRMSRARVIETVANAVRFARTQCDDVEFSPEDASRTEEAFLHEVLEVAIEAGAGTLNIPDTVGYSTPDEYGAMIARIRSRVPGADRVIISTHCHDDLGLAVANSLAGVSAGARQVECTINGIGERAGNAALEEIVMALRLRRIQVRADTRVDTRQIARTSHLVSQCTGTRVAPNKAIVGANAFAHEAGIHQDGVLKHPRTYEIMSAESVGQPAGRLVLGKHSGRHALRKHLTEAGLELTETEFHNVFARFKEVADRKKVVDDRDIEAIVAGETRRPVAFWAVDHVQVSTGTHAIPTATVRLREPDGSLSVASSQGDGPVDAICRTVNQVVGEVAELTEFRVDAVTEGINAVGGVRVTLRSPHAESSPEEPDGTPSGRYSGFAVHTDILVATAEAYVSAMNAMLLARRRLSVAAPSVAVSAAGGAA